MGTGLSDKQAYSRQYKFTRTEQFDEHVKLIGKLLKLPVEKKYGRTKTTARLHVGDAVYSVALGHYRTPGLSATYPVIWRDNPSGRKYVLTMKGISAWYPWSAYIVADYSGGDLFNIARNISALTKEPMIRKEKGGWQVYVPSPTAQSGYIPQGQPTSRKRALEDKRRFT